MTKSHLKKTFWPHIFVGGEIQFLGILQYGSGLNLPYASSCNTHIMCFDKDFQDRNEILLRDYLRKNPQWVEEYGRLKNELSTRYGLSSEYTKGKADIIQKVVDQARQEKGLPSMSVWEKEAFPSVCSE